MMLSLWTHNNPLLAPIMLMTACALLGFAVAYIALRIGRQRAIAAKVDEHTKSALTHLHAQLDDRDATIIDLNNRTMTQKQRIAVMILYLTKAITEGKLDDI